MVAKGQSDNTLNDITLSFTDQLVDNDNVSQPYDVSDIEDSLKVIEEEQGEEDLEGMETAETAETKKEDKDAAVEPKQAEQIENKDDEKEGEEDEESDERKALLTDLPSQQKVTINEKDAYVSDSLSVDLIVKDPTNDNDGESSSLLDADTEKV